MRSPPRFRPIMLSLACSILLAAPAPAEDFLIVIRTGPDIKPSNVEDAVVNALKATAKEGVTTVGPPLFRTISAADYNAYNRLGNPDAPLVPLPSQRKDTIEVRQLPAATPTWEFNLLGATPQQLSKLEVTYTDAPDKPVALTPTRKKDDPLTLTQFGSYVLKPVEGKQPLNYKASVREIGGTEDKVLSGDWPQGDNFFLIRLKGFKGNREVLADAIKDPKKTGGTALEAFNIKTDVTLAVGEAGAADDEPEDDLIDGNKLWVSVPQLRRNSANRVWMRFPLDDTQMDTELAELNALSANKLSDHIRKIGPRMAGQPVVITPDSKPMWIEVPLIARETPDQPKLKGGTFGRMLNLNSADSAAVTPASYEKLLATFPKANRIVVYEFENAADGIRNAIPYKRASTQKERKVANGSPMAIWGVQLARLAGKPAETPDKRK
jgi:hypothetical protein